MSCRQRCLCKVAHPVGQHPGGRPRAPQGVVHPDFQVVLSALRGTTATDRAIAAAIGLPGYHVATLTGRRPCGSFAPIPLTARRRENLARLAEVLGYQGPVLSEEVQMSVAIVELPGSAPDPPAPLKWLRRVGKLFVLKELSAPPSPATLVFDQNGRIPLRYFVDLAEAQAFLESL